MDYGFGLSLPGLEWISALPMRRKNQFDIRNKKLMALKNGVAYEGHCMAWRGGLFGALLYEV